MVKVRMNTVNVTADVKCLRRLIDMRYSIVYDLSPKTYMLKLMNSSGVTESGESENVLLLIESGIRLHATDYVRTTPISIAADGVTAGYWSNQASIVACGR